MIQHGEHADARSLLPGASLASGRGALRQCPSSSCRGFCPREAAVMVVLCLVLKVRWRCGSSQHAAGRCRPGLAGWYCPVVAASAEWRSREGLRPFNLAATSTSDESDRYRSAVGGAELSMVSLGAGSTCRMACGLRLYDDAWRRSCPFPRYDLLPRVRTVKLVAAHGGVV